VTALRAEARIGEEVTVLVEEVEGVHVTGRAQQQGPDDARSEILDRSGPTRPWYPGEIVRGRIADTQGVDWQVDVYDCPND